MSISKSFATALNDTTGSTPKTTRTTATFDTTGFTHILVGTKFEGGDTTVTPSSTAVSGSWTSHTKEIVAATSSDLVGQLFSAVITSATTGRTATITFAAGRTFSTVAVWVMNATSGVIALVAEANGEGTGTALDGGSLSNAGGDSVVSFMMCLEYSASTHTSAGWTGATNGAEDFDFGGSDNFTAGYSRGAETTNPIDPTATQTNSAAWGVLSLMFKEDAGGAAALSIAPIIQNYRNMGLMQ